MKFSNLYIYIRQVYIYTYTCVYMYIYRDSKKLLLPGPGSHLMSVASTIMMYNHTLKKAFRVKRKQLGLTQEAKGALL